jgi:hypothetical protein
MSAAKRYAKKHVKAKQRRHLKAQERLERDRHQAQQAAEALEQALHDLGLHKDLVVEIEGRLRSQKKLLGKILGVMCPPAVALKPRCEGNRVIMGLYHPPSTQPAWTRREPGGAHENPETIIRPTALDLST